MKSSFQSVLFVAILLAGIMPQSLHGQASSTNYKPKKGLPQVNFSLPTIDGNQMIELEQFKSKKLFLFYFASW